MKDLKKMAEDVDLMIERQNEQVDNLQKAQREELKQIEVGASNQFHISNRNFLNFGC